MQACSPERMESMLVDWVESRDPKISGKMTKNAELIRTHGKDAIICMMGRGIAEETATELVKQIVDSSINRSSVAAAVNEITKKKTEKYS